jgi:hypothetical protein
LKVLSKNEEPHNNIEDMMFLQNEKFIADFNFFGKY